MYVHRSNRMEGLVDELAAVLRKPKLSVLAPDVILIQSQGMERWLSRELSERLQGFANARFPFPRAFLREAMDAVLGPAPDAVLFERDTMTWAIAALLVELAPLKAFGPVTHYLADDPGGVRRLQLAERLAYLFDQYVIYRPKLVLGWEAGRGSDFQALLWRALIERYEHLGAMAGRTSSPKQSHFAARAAEFERRFSPLFVERDALPARLAIVGGASLPPLFLRLLGKLAECVEVHLFALAPTREYLGQPERGAEKLAWSSAGHDVHPLLASLASVGSAFQQLLERDVSYVDGPAEFVDLPSDSVLHALQSDLLNNRQRSASERMRRPRPDEDDSITLVSCHSPMREVEVLRDRLLALFAADPSLRPDDVVVMAPRIEQYVPLIEAVFSAEPGDEQAIPFRIADRSERSANPAAEGLLQVLRVVEGRLKASEVLDLLQCAPIRRRFAIEATDLPTIYQWVHEAGIRWGRDAAHRAEYGLPAEPTNTWAFGLNRLLLGHALDDDGTTLFGGVVPEGAAAGEGELLGRFVRFCETLFESQSLARGARSVAAWCGFLRNVADSFLADEQGAEWQVGPVYAAVHDLEQAAERASFSEPIALEVLVAKLTERFETETSNADFVAGGVTFCAMLPLRSIPFRVVALLGMNDGEFPRVESQLGFDKMAERPELGDRSQRAEDRYLFLETLLSARERLLISYVGRGIQDNQERPPSVLVAELASAIEGLLAPRAAGEPEYLAPAQHPLQPFSPRAFDGADPKLASFSEMYASGARALVQGQEPIRPFFGEPLPADRAPAQTQVELEDLVAFFKSPARALLRHLGVRLDEELRLVEDREAVESDALVRFGIGMRLLEAQEVETTQQVEQSRGVLPLGAPGRVYLEEIGSVTGALRRAKGDLASAGLHPPLPLQVRLPVGAKVVELVGALEETYRLEGAQDRLRQVSASFARLSAKYELAAWVRHLAAQAAESPVCETWILGRAADDTVLVERFGPVPPDRARALLADLLELYRFGHLAPLPFLPTISRTFADRVRSAPDDPELEEKALVSAERSFHDPMERGGNEGNDAHVEWAFRGTHPIRDVFEAGADAEDVPCRLTFAEVSRRVFLPLFEFLEEQSVGEGGDA